MFRPVMDLTGRESLQARSSMPNEPHKPVEADQRESCGIGSRLLLHLILPIVQLSTQRAWILMVAMCQDPASLLRLRRFPHLAQDLTGHCGILSLTPPPGRLAGLARLQKNRQLSQVLSFVLSTILFPLPLKLKRQVKPPFLASCQIQVERRLQKGRRYSISQTPAQSPSSE